MRKMAFKVTASVLAFGVAATPLYAQETTETTTSVASDSAESSGDSAIIVTGSRIKQDPTKSALPLQVVTSQELQREGINSPEQLISYLSTNGNGSDNLAANSDVTSGAQRGTNGLSAANLRGQGASSTLVLLNGRRVAAHGLTGSAVDVNQIPFAAIERVEVLKDGASAIYGTDAIGGVINFITKTNYQGLTLNGFTDFTERGDGNIYRLSATAGYGDLEEQGFNIMGAVSYSWNKILRGSKRDFVNTNQPERGLSADTRGTPIATIFSIGANGIFAPNGSLLAGTAVPNGGVNTLDLPGGAGCDSVEGGMAYDELLWGAPTARYACAWDTGRAAVLQQPLQTLTYYGRATVKLGDHQAYAEITGSDAESRKIFSHNQYSGNTAALPLYYPLNNVTQSTYNGIFNQLVAAFPNDAALRANYGKPIAYRWRCIACGEREYITDTNTLRAALGLEGPIATNWDYRVGGSFARSRVTSTLGSGYHYRGVFPNAAYAAASGVTKPDPNDPTKRIPVVAGDIDPRAPIAPGATAPGIVGLLNSGILNPFSVTQTPEAMAALKAISAEGVMLYSGQYKVTQFDGSVSGTLFALPGGDAKLAAGIDYRRESYTFDGSSAGIVGAPDIFNVAFDNVNALEGLHRTVKAAYAEILLPVFDRLDVTLAGRVDDYTGFGTTWNPKVAVQFRPTDWLMFRGSYSTGFRVPNFNQIFNGTTESPITGASLGDPLLCPNGVVTTSVPGCVSIASQNINAETLNGGKLDVGPEKSKQYSVGVVVKPSRHFTASVDFWSINVDDVIGAPTSGDVLRYSQFFADRIIRNQAGVIDQLDLRTGNLGSRRTQGIELVLRGGFDVGNGALTAGIDGTYLVKKKERFVDEAPWRDLVGIFTYTGDLGLRWKHNAFVTWSNDDISVSFSQIFRKGYENNRLIAGALTRPDYNEKVKDYVIYNLSTAFKVTDRYQMTLGVRNLFDTDPPFAITYDSNTGAGSSWEPRVADPRGRSFTVGVEAKF
ncbi:TonB-dependent receptor [Pseudonocardia sp. TMWB2A]